MKKILIAMLVFFALTFLLLNHYFSDVKINKYPSLAEVKDDKAIQRGWVPAIIPESAYDIAVTHDIDTNMILGSFQYKEKGEEKFMQNLIDINDAKQTLEWKDFLFRVDKEHNKVKFRRKLGLTQ